MKRFIFLAVILLVGTATFAQKKAIKPPFTKGVNFSLWLQAPSADLIDTNFFTEQDFKNVKSLGCDVIRLPIHFENLSNGAPDYTIYEKVFSILDNAVQWATKYEIYLVLDNHSWSNDEPTPKDIEYRLLQYWPQIAQRYKDSSKYVVYELLNEPHGIDNKKWGKTQQNVINAIRTIDNTHTIVVGGADFNSYNSMISLPNFSDGNIIYTFHYYDPMTFTHQGAEWIKDLARIKDIPFPYSKMLMPPKPRNTSGTENSYFDNYKETSNKKNMEEVFENLADFSIKRKASIWCGEFGVYMKYASEKDRLEWYKTVVDFMDKRNIARTNWDYYDSFGLFNKDSNEFFPNDLNTDILSALKYNIPSNAVRYQSWNERSKKTGDYTIYKNGFAKDMHPLPWFNGYEKFCSYEKSDSENECFIDLKKVKPYAGLRVAIKGGAQLSNEKDNEYALEFEARTNQNDIKLAVYFMNSNKTGEEWRATANVTKDVLPADGEWHKIRIPLKDFVDNGAWNNLQKVWINSLGIFDWNDIQKIVFENQDKEITSGISFREIRITK